MLNAVNQENWTRVQNELFSVSLKNDNNNKQLSELKFVGIEYFYKKMENNWVFVCNRTTSAASSLAGKRSTGGQSIWTQFGWRHRESLALAFGAANRSEFGVHLSSSEHPTG